MEQILSDVCKRDQFTCQQCGKSMADSEPPSLRYVRERQPPTAPRLKRGAFFCRVPHMVYPQIVSTDGDASCGTSVKQVHVRRVKRMGRP